MSTPVLKNHLGMSLNGPVPEPDTDPEPFALAEETPRRCYACGRDDTDTFQSGKTWTIRALRKWLATRMTASEAIAVTAEFVRRIG